MTLPTVPGTLYRHVDGGVYRFITVARHTDTQLPHVVYEHVWPFDTSEPWARPAQEWPSRFSEMTQRALEILAQGDRLAAQANIATAKAERRAREQQKS